MLGRQFSLRWLLLVTTVCAVVSLLIALSLAGSRAAVVPVAALLSLLIVMLAHTAFWAIVWLFVLARHTVRRHPFPTDQSTKLSRVGSGKPRVG